MKKAFFCLLILLTFSLYAQRKEVIKTDYFDIIYSPESKTTAMLVASHADEYAQEISARLGKSLPHRYPVYISSKSEFLNGYYTLFPYQRIVIYDATLADGELSNSYDAILNVFYHELTHAISLWYWLPTLSLSFDEGVAVLFESRGDQGRLNDPLIHHQSCKVNWMELLPLGEMLQGIKMCLLTPFGHIYTEHPFCNILSVSMEKISTSNFFTINSLYSQKKKLKRFLGKV